MFHGPDDAHETTLFYEGSTFLLFVTFLCMVTIVIMNLLVSSYCSSPDILDSYVFEIKGILEFSLSNISYFRLV